MCTRTGLMFPSDYVENWGKKYGIGLGPVPVSEALVNDYHFRACGEGENKMIPVGVCRAPIAAVECDADEYEAKKATLAIDDPKMSARAQIMRERQIAHGKLVV
jgi:hypothetical protein